MAQADVTVLEYGHIEDVVEQRLRNRCDGVDIDTLTAETDVEVAKIEAAMAHMVDKYDHIDNAGIGRWAFELPDE